MKAVADGVVLARRLAPLGLLCAAAWLAAARGDAQLIVTEVMSNPIDAGDTAWEWIEVVNTGAAAIDLDGYLTARVGDAEPVDPAVNESTALNTVIPGNSAAVLYRGQIGGLGDYDDAAFREAWSLSPSVPLVAVQRWPALTNNVGAAFGFWPAAGLPSSALVDDGQGGSDVGSLDGAAISLDFRTDSGFPDATNGASLVWSGQGSQLDGLNWAPTEAGLGITSSVAVTRGGERINGLNDAGSPGSVPAGPAAAGLLVTEIMYNPESSDSDWEWVELYNNTPAGIDLSGQVFHDTTSGDLDAANIASGFIAQGDSAVLYDADALTLQNMVDAWDPGGTLGVNFIGVSSFPQLGNGGDTVGIWPSHSAYLADSGVTPRTVGSATVSVAYENSELDWPNDDGDGSIYLTDLNADPATGGNWSLSDPGASDGSRVAAAALGLVVIHPGGDLGTPGVAPAIGGGADADFDDDGDVDGADLALWRTAFGAAATAATGDANGDGIADGSDFLLWQRQYTGSLPPSGAVPEPSAAMLAAAALGAMAWGRRRGRETQALGS